MSPSLGTLPIDLPKLLETRLLVQANSGGGKSMALRRLLEETANSVQQIVIDPEGEFASLRERFDYIVCAPRDADAVANPATAAALARAIWESGTSAIVDIYELKAHERVLFVRRFLEALINAPKAIWHPAMIVIDEVHMFAPQAGQCESLAAVVDLATRGRKRGLALVAATQRLSKLHKDVAAELLNKLIGRTGLDVDVQRAADELGMTRADALRMLRGLEPGQFFAFGPALTRAVEQTTIGPVVTTHPKTGARGMTAPPPPSRAVMAKLQKLEGIQREAEAEVRTAEQLAREVTDLRRKLTIAEKKQAPAAGVPEAEVQRRIAEALGSVPQSADATTDRTLAEARNLADQLINVLNGSVAAPSGKPSPSPAAAPRARASLPPPPAAGPVAEGISAPQQRILDVLAQLEKFGLPAAGKAMLAAHAGVSPTSGGYFNNLGRLRSLGLIDYPTPGAVSMTPAGQLITTYPDKAPTLRELHESWLRAVSNPQAAILEVLLARYPKAIAKDELADAVGVSRTSGGYFNNLGHLRTLGAIDYPQKGQVAATDILFPKGNP